MKILHILPSVDPKSGGPMEGVQQMGKWLTANGHEVEVVCLDSPDAEYVMRFPLKIYALGPSFSNYKFNTKLTKWLIGNAKNYDSVVVNGLWQYHGFGAWRALKNSGVPYYVFTHGMLDPWFKRAYPLKHLKKCLYWPWAEYRLLRDANAVIFTCEEERLLARESFSLYKVNEAVTSYGTATPPQDIDRLKELFFSTFPDLRDKRILLFLSRIHEKKGIDLLISAFAKAMPKSENLHLVIAGPDKGNLMPSLKALADSKGVSDKISWPGMLLGDMKWGAFHACDAFVLISHQENFGIAVAEALACSKPVLISNKVNIWREIQEDKAGIIGNDDEAGASHIFDEFFGLDQNQLQQMEKAALSCFNKRFTIESMSKSFLKIINPR